MPLLGYLGVTLAGPAVNGAMSRDGFREHALITMALSVVMTLIWLALERLVRRALADRST